VQLKILITGASGFVGTNILKKLSKNKKYKLLGVINKKKSSIKKNIKYLKADLEKKKDCIKVTKGIDMVIMCAAKSSGAKIIINNPLAHLNPNIIMNANMLNASYINKVKKFIFISSSTVYPNKKNFMKESYSNFNFFEKYFIVGWMKKFGEIMCLMYSKKIKNPMKTLVIRPSNLYGPYDKFDWEESKVIAATVRKFYEKHNPIEVWGDGNDIKDFLFIDDFVDCVSKLINKDTGLFNIFNIGSGKQTTVKMVINKLAKIMKTKKLKINYNKSKPSLIPIRRIDISKIKKFINWQPKIGLQEGLKRTMQWYKNNSL